MDAVDLPAGLRPRIVTRGRVVAAAFAFAVVLGACVWVWSVMIRMPGTSHRGALPPASADERALAAGLEADVRALASFGERSVARPEALAPFLKLAWSWDDYPPEPLPNDGTMLHAIERLLPFAAQKQGYDYATVHVAGITR